MEKSKSKVYLAGSFTTKKEIEVFNLVEEHLSTLYENIYLPRDHVVKNAWHLSNISWGEKVFENDMQGIDECDEVVAIYWGAISSTGTAWEVGYAYAKGKPVHVILITEDDPNKNYSLMMFHGCTKVSTLKGFLADIDEDKELMKLTLK